MLFYSDNLHLLDRPKLEKNMSEEEVSTICDHCEGEGFENDPCDTCDRDGWVDDPSDGGTMTCPDCNGDSWEPCTAECIEGYFYK